MATPAGHYTIQTCELACQQESYCTEFRIGRGDGIKVDQCVLYNPVSSCTYVDDVLWDTFTSAVGASIPPSTDIDVCTHLQDHNTDKPKRVACIVITSADSCHTNC